jgi:hypothetical protein
MPTEASRSKNKDSRPPDPFFFANQSRKARKRKTRKRILRFRAFAFRVFVIPFFGVEKPAKDLPSAGSQASRDSGTIHRCAGPGRYDPATLVVVSEPRTISGELRLVVTEGRSLRPAGILWPG